jgi:hypothetical protein
MTITPLTALENLTFINFNAEHIAQLTGMLDNAIFISGQEWEQLPNYLNYYSQDNLGYQHAIVRGQISGNPVDVFIGEQHLKHVQERKISYTPLYWLYIDITLPFSVPHVRVHPQATTVLAIKGLINSVNVDLEGDFSELFTVETSAENQISAFELLPPDTMLHLLEKIPDVFLEYQDNHLFIRLPLKMDYGKSMHITFGYNTSPKIHFKDTWESFCFNLHTTLAAIPELVDSANIAKIAPESFTLIAAGDLLKNKGKKIMNGIGLVIFSLILMFMVSIIALSFVGDAYTCIYFSWYIPSYRVDYL